jgi:elongation factor G
VSTRSTPTSASHRSPTGRRYLGREGIEGRFVRQTGGRGQFGHVWLEVEPLPAGQGFEFVNKIVGGSVPTGVHSCVEAGVKEAMETGGGRLSDRRRSRALVDGSYHEVDSSEMAFKIAGSMALKNAAVEGRRAAAGAGHEG